MISNDELYGEGIAVPNVPKGVANIRIQLLKKRMGSLLALHYTKQDKYLITKVSEAIAFWTKLRDGDTL